MTESSAGIHEYKDLLYGDYLTREIKAPEGYTVDRNYYAFSIKKDGETVKVGNNADGNFYNKNIKGNIEGVKVGESDEPLSGAVIGLFADGESEFTAENALAAVTTEKDGKFIFKDIVYGKYIVAEIQSPTGYILTEELQALLSLRKFGFLRERFLPKSLFIYIICSKHLQSLLYVITCKHIYLF
jgi:uncharacterized surface anchored protein